MKKLFLSLLVLSGFATLAPQARADEYVKQFRGYDHCGRPVYRYVAVPDCYERRSYRDDYCEAPRTRGYYREYRSARPVVRYESVRGRHHRSHGLLSFVFGF